MTNAVLHLERQRILCQIPDLVFVSRQLLVQHFPKF